MDILLVLFLLTCFVSSFTLFHAQTPAGFISLDCGLNDSQGIEYEYQRTKVHYSPDDNYVETGEKHTISGDLLNVYEVFKTLRSFPGKNGRKDCYTLPAKKGKQILLRAGVYYGNYDGLNRQPKFEIYLGVTRWCVVSITGDGYYRWEIIHTPTADSLHMCLLNIGNGDPFISYIDLRPMDPLPPSPPIYTRPYGSLVLSARSDMGSTVEDREINVVRYNEDIYDRMWRPPFSNSTSIISTEESNFTQNQYSPPIAVMRTAQQALATNESLKISFDSFAYSFYFYACLHFAELKLDTKRNMSVFINDELIDGPFVPSYLTVNTITHIFTSSNFELEIRAEPDSSGPAFINAMELYYLVPFSEQETNKGDAHEFARTTLEYKPFDLLCIAFTSVQSISTIGGVEAIGGVKVAYSITESSWQGDPCLPKNSVWLGVNCSYNGTEPPTIISLNLSSKGLNGIIPPTIANLTMLQSLDLSFNNLNGNVPDFLAWIPSLKYLNLEGNNFTTPLPPSLKEKSENGSLTLKVTFNQSAKESPCADNSCQKKNQKNYLPAITSSIAAAVTIIVIFVVILRRRYVKAAKRVSVKSKGHIEVNSIAPRLRQFTLPQVMSFISDENILGRGGFGTVYLGRMDGMDVAIKILHQCPKEEMKNFISEVKILATVYHKNLTRIFGYCDEGTDKAIILEFVENKNLKHHLSEGNPQVLSWERRIAIILGAAEGLEYLHHGCNPPIIHRDIKPENILLTKEFEAKLADFGLSRIFSTSTISSTIVGTLGYLDIGYNEQTMLTEKRDVYSFGVVMLVVIAGRPAIRKGSTHITEWVHSNILTGDIEGVVDPRLEGIYDMNAAWKVVELAMACVSNDSSKRPSMKYVVKELQQCLPVPDIRDPHNELDGNSHSSHLGETSHSDTSSLFMPRPR